MKRSITVFTLLLLCQIGLVLVQQYGSADYGAFQPEKALIPFDPEVIDTIRIAKSKQEEIMLKKQDGHWILPGLNAFPADNNAVQDFLRKLQGLKKGWPVATTAEAAKRFKVDKGDYERRIILFTGNKKAAELFIGTSPGYRKVHARAANKNEVFSVAFAAYEAGVKNSDWLDRDILKHDVKEISAIELPGIKLVRQKDGFTVDDLSTDEKTVDHEAQSLAEKIAGLTIEDVLGPENNSDSHLNTPDLAIILTLQGKKKQTYLFGKPDKGDWYVLKVSGRKNLFRVASWQVKAIKEISRDKLVSKKTAPDNTKPAAP